MSVYDVRHSLDTNVSALGEEADFKNNFVCDTKS
jgi:hypothetical protein